jgi:hypothetical protein
VGEASHAEAGGTPSPKDGADAVSSPHEGVTPFDTDTILGEFPARGAPARPP